MTYATAITSLAALLAANTSAKTVHQDPPESLSQFPCWVLGWARGNGIWVSIGLTEESTTLMAVLYLSRQILPISNASIRTYIQEFRDMIAANRTVSGAFFAVDNWAWEGPVAITYGDKILLGIRFEITGRLVTDP